MYLRSITKASLAVAVLLFGAQYAVSQQPSLTQTEKSFRVKITVVGTDRPAFNVPARILETDSTFVLIPTVAEKVDRSREDLPSFIRVIPQMDGDSVRIKVSVLYGKVDKNVTPDQLKALKETSLTDVVLGDGEKVTITELRRFGIKPLEIEAFSGPCIGLFSTTSTDQISISSV